MPTYLRRERERESHPVEKFWTKNHIWNDHERASKWMMPLNELCNGQYWVRKIGHVLYFVMHIAGDIKTLSPSSCSTFYPCLQPSENYLVSFLFVSHDKYTTNLTLNDTCLDGVLETWTQGDRMVGTDKSNELWQHPNHYLVSLLTEDTDEQCQWPL